MDIHDVHCRSLDGENTIFSAHIVYDTAADMVMIKKSIKHMLDHKYHIHHSTLEFEQAYEVCE